MLRRRGGLDEHFARAERVHGPSERIQAEYLEDLQRRGTGCSPRALLEQLHTERQLLAATTQPGTGIELLTIHRAKGRQWPHVILFGADADQLPHRRADADGPDGVEAERRIAYVALTRASARLTVLCCGDPSPFLEEAGLAAVPAPRAAPVTATRAVRPAAVPPVPASWPIAMPSTRRRPRQAAA